MSSESKPSIIGGALLVAGTSIGAGMLALPVVTALGGFGPSLLVYGICWLFMTCTGLLLLEICLKMPPDANLVSMAGTYLGRWGKTAAWILYVFLFYCLSVAYVSGGGSLLRDWLGLPSAWQGAVLFFVMLAPCVYFGAKMVERVNSVLMLGLVGAYCVFVVLGMRHVDAMLLGSGNMRAAILALPVIFTSFSYQGIIPTLATYMRRDAKRLRLAIMSGTTLSFVIYVLWELLILGIVPVTGEHGLEQARQLGQTAVQPLKFHLGESIIPTVGAAFAFFAITTSYLGVTLGLFDFLADGLRMAKRGLQRLFLGALTFVPPLVIALVYPRVFISALVLAGGIGCALLLGLLPTLMVWVARRRSEPGPVMVPGGKPLLCVFGLFVLTELVIELIPFIRNNFEFI